MIKKEPILLLHEKSLLDRAIDGFVANDGKPTAGDINNVVVAAQVQYGIDRYRAEAANLSFDELQQEQHSSLRLARHLTESGKPRPANCHAHAIVAGKHHNAAVIRALMARHGIRIDDVDNGCWLPENTAATPHPAFPRAIPHSRIHRYNYYFWIRSRLERILKPDLFRVDLQLIAKHLQEHTCPEYVMLKKGQNLPSSRRFS